MSYATHDDVFKRYGMSTTLVGTQATDVQTVDIDSVYLADAESYINAFLRPRYSIPLVTEPLITGLCSDIAIYRMVEDRCPRIPDICEKRWINANSTLCMLRDGVMQLGSSTLVTSGDQEAWSNVLSYSGPVFMPIEASTLSMVHSPPPEWF